MPYSALPNLKSKPCVLDDRVVVVVVNCDFGWTPSSSKFWFRFWFGEALCPGVGNKQCKGNSPRTTFWLKESYSVVLFPVLVHGSSSQEASCSGEQREPLLGSAPQPWGRQVQEEQGSHRQRGGAQPQLRQVWGAEVQETLQVWASGKGSGQERPARERCAACLLVLLVFCWPCAACGVAACWAC